MVRVSGAPCLPALGCAEGGSQQPPHPLNSQVATSPASAALSTRASHVAPASCRAGADLTGWSERVPGALAPRAGSLSPVPSQGRVGMGGTGAAPPGGNPELWTLGPYGAGWSRDRASSDVPVAFLPGLPPSPFSPGAPGAPSRPSRPSRPGRPWLPWWPGVPGRPGCPGHRLGILLSSNGGEPAARPRSSRARRGLMALARGARIPGSFRSLWARQDRSRVPASWDLPLSLPQRGRVGPQPTVIALGLSSRGGT